MADDVILHKLNLILEILATVQLNGTKSPNDIHVSFTKGWGLKGALKRSWGLKGALKMEVGLENALPKGWGLKGVLKKSWGLKGALKRK